MKTQKELILIKNKEIEIIKKDDVDYISLTDIAKIKNDEDPNGVIEHWLRKVDTLNFIFLWERINNIDFKPPDFGGFKTKPGENSFTISPSKLVNITNAISLLVKSGKYSGGTFAHKDIALEFAGWVSPEIKLYIIKEFQRLKEKEEKQKEWNSSRLLSKANYLIQTDTIKKYLILIDLTPSQINYIYASEADLLNVALFGKTAKEWRILNPSLKGNIRDYVSAIELIILSNLEYLNAKLIEEKKTQKERLIILNKEANKQKELFNNSLINK